MSAASDDVRAGVRRLECRADGVELLVVDERARAATLVADEIQALLRRARADAPAVLGLATGRSPLEAYAELVRRHAAGALSFAHARSFNLDEYWPMEPDDPGSFRQVMATALFDQVDLPADAARLPDGSVERDDVEAECAAYEQAIRDAGGIDLQLLGIGRNGHLGFNEPGSPLDARTRLVHLAASTRADAAASHRGTVPHHAITVGLGTILEARRLVLLAFGAAKADAVHAALTGPVCEDVPASVIQRHGDVTVLLDENAAAGWRTD